MKTVSLTQVAQKLEGVFGDVKVVDDHIEAKEWLIMPKPPVAISCGHSHLLMVNDVTMCIRLHKEGKPARRIARLFTPATDEEMAAYRMHYKRVIYCANPICEQVFFIEPWEDEVEDDVPPTMAEPAVKATPSADAEEQEKPLKPVPTVSVDETTIRD
jgi:hypothetical protein